jgi:hypothetical protein
MNLSFFPEKLIQKLKLQHIVVLNKIRKLFINI